MRESIRVERQRFRYENSSWPGDIPTVRYVTRELEEVEIESAKLAQFGKCVLGGLMILGLADEPINISLEQRELTSISICLSYMWSTDEATYPILLNGKQFLVRYNLWDFLRHERTSPHDEWPAPAEWLPGRSSYGESLPVVEGRIELFGLMLFVQSREQCRTQCSG